MLTASRSAAGPGLQQHQRRGAPRLQRHTQHQQQLRAVRRSTAPNTPTTSSSAAAARVVATWTRPTPDRDETWTRPSYVPSPGQSPAFTPTPREDQPLYAPSRPEFQPAERPEQGKELPKGPDMPERRPDPIPAGNPKEKPPAGEPQTEAPPAGPKEK